MGEIKTGKYKHFKGKLCEVLFVAKHSENPKEEYVVYKEGRNVWIRPKSMFFETIKRDGYNGPRFKKLNERKRKKTR